jgi:hypothetical protein
MRHVVAGTDKFSSLDQFIKSHANKTPKWEKRTNGRTLTHLETLLSIYNREEKSRL